MLKRFPHKGTVLITIEDDSENGINTITEEKFIVDGRFEPAASKSDNIDYKAKFYCGNLDYILRTFIEQGLFPDDLISNTDTKEVIPFSIDGQTLIYNGKRFEIILLHNYQTHCEIWLE